MNEMTNTHILVHEFDYLEPASLTDAISLLAESDGRAQVMAGGTNLLVWMKLERRAPEYIINIAKLPGLDGIVPGDDGLAIGPLTTIRALRDSPLVQSNYTALAEACAAFGSTQIQMMGTLGGNVCCGSPASDTVPALLAFDAHLAIAGSDGEKPGFSEKTRFLPVKEFLLGPGKTALKDGELLTSIQLRRPQPGTGSAFIKISRVEADLAKASVAAVIAREGDRIVDCRLAYGAVGPTVMRARQAEASLVGQPFSAELALEAGRVAAEEITPIDDVRSSADYRRQVTKALTHDALLAAWERAEGTRRQGDKETRRQGDGETRGQGNGGTGKQGGREIRGATPHGSRLTLDVSRLNEHVITLTVNGVQRKLRVRPNELLLNVLRERLGLTGAKYGCGIGECGACTVLLNGRPVLACLVLAIAADGGEVLTVEGLQAPDGSLHPLQEAFIEQNGFQCGYCTPGMLMMTKSLLDSTPHPGEDEIRDYLKGNRCRCTGYASIVRAVEQVQKGEL